MGKQWLLCKVAGDGTAGGCNGGKSRKRRGDRHHVSSSSSSSGCMSAIFHLFDIQHHHFPFHQPSFISESTICSIHQEPNNIILKGVEAPRNSLELEEQEKAPMVEEEVTSSSSSSSTRKIKQETNFNTPMRDIQIKTKRSKLMDINDASSSECSSSSPGTKTPSLVARLMGLDLLPENSSPRLSLSSPRPSSSSSHATPLNPLSKLSSLKNNNNNTRSLPVTPRASTSTARPSTEVDYHHRLSLQVNKRRYDESTSEYAKQIAKQVRENISRRVGADITNTSKKKEHRRDEFLVVLKPKRPSPPSSATSVVVEKSRNLDQVSLGNGRGKENEPTPPSCSPRLKLLEMKKNNLNKPISKSSPLSSSTSSSTEVIKAPSSLPSITRSQPPMMMKEEVQVIKHENSPMKVQKCKKLASEKYDLRLKKLHQNEEPKCIKKCNNNMKKKKSTPLSNHLVNVNTTTKFISFKKDIIVSPSSTIASPQKQVTYESITELPSSCQSRSYNTKKTINHLSVQPDITTNGNGATTTTTGRASFSDHFDYISRILSHTGIQKTTPISITHWYSPSHPLHPSILENLNHPKTVTNRLIFDVVDELLVEILKPYISLKPWVSSVSTRRMFGTQLIETLCDKIRCFPEANCQVLEDIDGLIECDMKSNTKAIGEIAFEEEAEELVAEIERDLVDTLVGEMAASCMDNMPRRM